MKLLYSNILPYGTEDSQETVTERFMKEASTADTVEIAVGYVSKAALHELEQIVDEHKICHIVLTMGMYYVEGMPEGIYHTAIALNRKWVDAGIGEIRIIKAFKYHGKLYAFYKDRQVKSAIIGSANLGVIKPEANNRRQYEVSAITEEAAECNEIATLIRRMATPIASVRIDEVVDMPIIREVNTSLTGVDTVEQIPQTQVELFERHKTNISFVQLRCLPMQSVTWTMVSTTRSPISMSVTPHREVPESLETGMKHSSLSASKSPSWKVIPPKMLLLLS